MKKTLLLTMLLASITIQAQTSYTVTNTNDAGAGSLRNVAAGIAAGDTIRFNPNIIAAGSDTITLTTGEIDFGNKGVIIKGLYNATDTMYISGNNNSRIFSFNGAGEVVLDSLVLINGNGIGATNLGSGGAIMRSECTGTLFVDNSIISGNTSFDLGGGIYSVSNASSSSITVTNSIVSGNTALNHGGGIYSFSDSDPSFIIVTNSTISGNTSDYSGGGIYSFSSSSFVSAINSTVSGNTASSEGGGIYSFSLTFSSSTIVTNSTVSGNTANYDGGGIYFNSMITITSSIIAENGNGISGIYPLAITSGGYNIFSDAPIGGTVTTDQTGVTAAQLNLQPLAFNGGSTQTMLPGAGSVAINLGDLNDMSDAQNRSVSEGRRDVGAAETVCATTAGVHNETVCFGGSIVVNGNTYDANTLTGTEVFTNVGSGNCDSTVTVTLTIESAIDVTTATTNQTITANQTGATYRWLNCNNSYTVIAGETSVSFIATANGDYAVEITIGSCVDTSACENVSNVGINENNFGDNIKLYPNPTKSYVVIDFGAAKDATVLVTDLTGKEVLLVENINSSTITLNTSSLNKGLYFVTIQSNNDQKILNLVKR
ncbi:MAG: parallel beta-helix repeat protein [Salibacteraceae bacterium]|jgi:parallel beta-helix repeat protein